MVSIDAHTKTAPWFEALIPSCEVALSGEYALDVLVFYLARWCQKKASTAEPSTDLFEPELLAVTASRIDGNLVRDGRHVDALVRGSAKHWTNLRNSLLRTAAARTPERASDFADEAMQKIAVILVAGTPPFRAADRLSAGPRGPNGEYVFASPFSFWAKRVAINHIIDDARREQRARRPHVPAHDAIPSGRWALLGRAREALPSLLDAIRALPPRQRAVMLMSLRRKELDEIVIQRLRQLAPDLFPPDDPRPSSDKEIAQLLGTSARSVAANRSVARTKLAEADELWELLLDVLLPHRSTRSPRSEVT